MAFGAAISGGIIMVMFVVILIMAIPVIINSNVTASRAYSERLQLDGEYSKTSMQITDVLAIPNDDIVDFTLNNDGLTKLWNYQKFNVLVTYDYSLTPLVITRTTESLSYAGVDALPPAGSWTITGFVDDGMDPQILNPEESITIRGRLNHDIAVSVEVVSITVSTDNGVIVSRSVVDFGS